MVYHGSEEDNSNGASNHNSIPLLLSLMTRACKLHIWPIKHKCMKREDRNLPWDVSIVNQHYDVIKN